MTLTIEVKGSAKTRRPGNVAEIRIIFYSKADYRNVASSNITKAVEEIQDALKELCHNIEPGPSNFQATASGGISKWCVSSWETEAHRRRMMRSIDAYQISFTVRSIMRIFVDDMNLLPKIADSLSKMTYSRFIYDLMVHWHLDDVEAARRIAEVRELAAKDASNKASAIASSMGFSTVFATKVTEDDTSSTSSNTLGGWWQVFKTEKETLLSSSDRDAVGKLDCWKFVLVPRNISIEAHVSATFSTGVSDGWNPKDSPQQHYLTN